MADSQDRLDELRAAPGLPEAIGQSEAFLDSIEQLSRVASVERPVLLIGERGTGKELAAARLHYLSKRWERPLVTLNCAALSLDLVESELFGHEAGAFTGAERRRAGRFETADGGTLFLDEISNTPLEVQEKILRVVEYGCFERVGGSRAVNVDVRLVAAANVNLPALADAGRFKRDLLDRLSFEVLFLPPLRERAGDVVLLATHFAARMAHELGRTSVPEFSDEALAALEAHRWPGNVRELKNVVERAVYRSTTDAIEQIDFDPFRSPYAPEPSPTPAGAAPTPEAAPEDAVLPDGEVNIVDAVAAFEARIVRRALLSARHNQKKAAEFLGLSYHQFRRLCRKHRGRLT
jgi:psp operon transcriptional activator